MANDLNLCQFIGRLGKDPEQRFLPNGDAVTNFSLACGWKGKDKEGTEWIDCVSFKKLAEIINQYCQKGSQIYVSGKMRTRKWQDKDGNNRYSTEVVVDQMQLLARAGEGQPRQSEPQQPSGGGYEPPFDDNSDIPF